MKRAFHPLLFFFTYVTISSAGIYVSINSHILNYLDQHQFPRAQQIFLKTRISKSLRPTQQQTAPPSSPSPAGRSTAQPGTCRGAAATHCSWAQMARSIKPSPPPVMMCCITFWASPLLHRIKIVLTISLL